MSLASGDAQQGHLILVSLIVTSLNLSSFSNFGSSKTQGKGQKAFVPDRQTPHLHLLLVLQAE